jgi:hypothetical protein
VDQAPVRVWHSSGPAADGTVFRAFRELLQWEAERVSGTRQLSRERTSLFQCWAAVEPFSAADFRRYFPVVFGALETDYAFSRFLSLSTILQIDTANAQAASANVRLRWNYPPDSDLYLIYTAGQKFASLAAVSPAQFYENRFAIKFTYSWRP